MNREELKAEALINLGSEPAPKEWEKLTCIKEQMPSCIGGEVSLQRFVGTDICAWFVGIGGLWEPQSDYFRVSLPTAEGAEAFVKSKGLNLDYVKGIQLFLNPKYTVIDLMSEFAAQQQPKLDPNKVQWSGYGQLGNISQKPPQPTAEGAEEIDDETIAWAAEHQCGTPFSERWIGFVKGAKWHRSLHAQRIADKMVSEKCKNCKYRDLPDSINEALNSGDGVYRP